MALNEYANASHKSSALRLSSRRRPFQRLEKHDGFGDLASRGGVVHNGMGLA
jgi:hypothetical protein